MYEEPSCGDCKVDDTESKWTQILLNWINICIEPENNIKILEPHLLSKAVELYEDDISFTTENKKIAPEHVEELLMNEYQIDLTNASLDDSKKLYITFSLLLYHCCVTTKGEFTNDICEKLSKGNQEIVLNYCEELCNTAITVENVEKAIKDAFNVVPKSSTTSYASSHSVASKLSKNSQTLKLKSSATEIQSRLPIQPSSTSHCTITSNKNIDLTKTDVFSVSAYENKIAVMTVKKEEKCNMEFYGKSVPCLDGPPPRHSCKPGCTCAKCRLMRLFKEKNKGKKEDRPSCIKDFYPSSWYGWCCVMTKWIILATLITGLLMGLFFFLVYLNDKRNLKATKLSFDEESASTILRIQPEVLIWGWECRDNICQKIFEPKTKSVHLSYNRCTLLCMGPLIWPQPTGFKSFNQSLIALTTNRLNVYFDEIPSEIVHQYLYKEFNAFLSDLKLLEGLKSTSRVLLSDLQVQSVKIRIAVTKDPNPRLRLDTDESYLIMSETMNTDTVIRVNASSYCGARHGLETLRQLIMYDGVTGNLMSLADAVINDEPKFEYRGLMIDTARNFIPLKNLIATIDAMASCKLNTFHWRISDAMSFPLVVPELPELSDYGAYSSSMVYTVNDVKSLVNRATQKGIRVVMEVSSPGPVGRAWSWVNETTCFKREDTCNSALCNQLKMSKPIFDILQKVYAKILDMTAVDDVFHIGNSVFSLNCKILLSNREGYLKSALERLMVANKRREPKMVLAWYHRYILPENSWGGRAFLLHVWQEGFKKMSLTNYTLVHSSKWELSCLMKNRTCSFYRTWQNLYTWRPWHEIEAISHRGGQASLWTDLVDAGNMEYHLWPRAAAVAERLWSDEPTHGTVGEEVYIRLDAQRKRMQLRKFIVQPVWPQECSTNPLPCLETLRQDSKRVTRIKLID